MSTETLDVSPSPKPRHVINAKGETLKVPDTWALLEPGDAALSRRIKKDGPTWTMKEKKVGGFSQKGFGPQLTESLPYVLSWSKNASIRLIKRNSMRVERGAKKSKSPMLLILKALYGIICPSHRPTPHSQ